MGWISRSVRRVEKFIVELDMRERWAFVMKSGVIIVALIFVFQGHPPASGQQRMPPIDAAPGTQAVEDALQDKDLANLKLDIINQQGQLDKLKDVANIEDNRTTALETNWKAAIGLIGILQAGGIVLSYKRKTV